MKVFITGGSGFLGKQLIHDLISRGYAVTALVRSINSANIVRTQGATPVMGSLDDVMTMAEAMKDTFAVIHAAAVVRMWGSREEFESVNVMGTRNVIDAAKIASVPRLVYVGTEAVLADGYPIINTDETRPIPDYTVGLYAETKGVAEKRVLKSNYKNFTTMSVRPRFIWGIGDTTLLPAIVSTMKTGHWRWFGADHKMSTCHIRNASHGIILGMEKGLGGQAYFITDGEPVSFRDFISSLVKTQGVKPGGKKSPLWVAKVVSRYYELIWKLFNKAGVPPLTRLTVNLMLQEVTINDSKARMNLGYKPVITIEEGMAEMVIDNNQPIK